MTTPTTCPARFDQFLTDNPKWQGAGFHKINDAPSSIDGAEQAFYEAGNRDCEPPLSIKTLHLFLDVQSPSHPEYVIKPTPVTPGAPPLGPAVATKEGLAAFLVANPNFAQDPDILELQKNAPAATTSAGIVPPPTSGTVAPPAAHRGFSPGAVAVGALALATAAYFVGRSAAKVKRKSAEAVLSSVETPAEISSEI